MNGAEAGYGGGNALSTAAMVAAATATATATASVVALQENNQFNGQQYPQQYQQRMMPMNGMNGNALELLKLGSQLSFHRVGLMPKRSWFGPWPLVPTKILLTDCLVINIKLQQKFNFNQLCPVEGYK